MTKSPQNNIPLPVPPLGARAGSVYDELVAQTRAAISQAGFSAVTLGLSGGLDSALLAVIAADALGGECVHPVLMPSAWTSEASERDAREVAQRLGLQALVLPIMPTYEALLDTLSGVFRNTPLDVTEENLQARVRGVLLMALSNKFDLLVLAPNNLSELLTGYTTLYGDMVGAFAPLAPVLKTWVYELAHAGNTRAKAMGQIPPIPDPILSKEPSAELAVGQRDRDVLGPYSLLDAVLYQAWIQGRGSAELIQAGFDSDYVEAILQKVYRTNFKRMQACPGAILTGLEDLA